MLRRGAVPGRHSTRQTYSFKKNRESLAIADQSLDIIQAWGEAFLPRRVSRFSVGLTVDSEAIEPLRRWPVVSGR